MEKYESKECEVIFTVAQIGFLTTYYLGPNADSIFYGVFFYGSLCPCWGVLIQIH